MSYLKSTHLWASLLICVLLAYNFALQEESSMPSLHPCMFLVLNSVSPHDFNSPSEFLSRCRHVGATPGHIFFTLWLVIPYSWRFPAYFSFFQNPLYLYWCIDDGALVSLDQKKHNNHPKKPEKTRIQNNKSPITDEDHSSCSSAIRSCTPKAIACSAHGGPSRNGFQEGRLLHFVCVSRPTTSYRFGRFG